MRKGTSEKKQRQGRNKENIVRKKKLMLREREKERNKAKSEERKHNNSRKARK